jgi:Ca2+-transporting ATPase
MPPRPRATSPRPDEGEPPASGPRRKGEANGVARAPAHARAVDDVLGELGVDPSAGLTDEEARARRARSGPNVLPRAPTRSALVVFVRQYQSPLIYLLLGADVLAFALGQRSDAVVIVVVVTINAIIGAVQEGRAARSMDALRRLSMVKARVVRGGRERELDARELVPGDVILLAPGESVGADARLVEVAALTVSEAVLTGESVPVAKSTAPRAVDAALPDLGDMVFAGTHIAAGRGRAVVTATGARTEVGAIAALASAAEEPKTPLERRIAELGRTILLGGAVMAAVVVAIGLARRLPPVEVAMLAVAQFVAMVPEGLPVAVTVALALGAHRMAKRGAIVRRLVAVETLGSTTVVCTDKTGTLTKNEMTVTTIVLPGGRVLAVGGTGYTSAGRITERGREVDAARDGDLRALLEAGVLGSDADLVRHEDGGPPRPLGDPTEVALVTLGAKGGVDARALRAREPRRAEIPFDAATKMMATEHAARSGPRVIVKGAPEPVLALCAAARRGGVDVLLDDAALASLRSAWESMAARALRVLAVAEARGVALDPARGFEPLRGEIALLGLVAQIDPPRDEAIGAVRECRAAGVRLVMVTGDHTATGLAVARELDVTREGDRAIDGAELERTSDADLARRIGRIAVFGRVLPAQKLRIVRALQAVGEVVAMTGDGVNDAPALARADVGVAMGRSGTEVAKEAARVVLTDDDVSTLVHAIAEGRAIHRNLRKLLLYLVSTSISGVIVLVVGLAIGLPSPLVAVQVLWVNLVADGAVAIPLILDPPEGDEMRRPPPPASEALLPAALRRRVAVMVPAMAISTLGYFAHRLAMGVPLLQARTEAFTVLAVCQWFNALNCRSELASALGRGRANGWLVLGVLAGMALQAAVVFAPPLQRSFHTTPLDLGELGAVVAVASLVLWVEEARKAVDRRRRRPGDAASRHA